MTYSECTAFVKEVPVFVGIMRRFWLAVVLLGAVLWEGALASDHELPMLRFVYMENYAPFCFRDENGRVAGIQPEIVQALANRLGMRVVHQLFPWKRAQRMVELGQADAMLTTPTAERFRYAVFAREETTPNLWNIFVRAEDERMNGLVPGFRSLEDLKPYRLLDFQGNGWTHAFMKPEDGFTNIEFVASPALLPRMLVSGRGDLVLMSSAVMNYHARKQGLSDKIREYDIDWTWTRFHQVIQVSRKSPWANTALIKALDQATREIKAEGIYQEILRKYGSRVGEGYPFRSQLDDAYLKSLGFYEDYETLPEYTGPESLIPLNKGSYAHMERAADAALVQISY